MAARCRPSNSSFGCLVSPVRVRGSVFFRNWILVQDVRSCRFLFSRFLVFSLWLNLPSSLFPALFESLFFVPPRGVFLSFFRSCFFFSLPRAGGTNPHLGPSQRPPRMGASPGARGDQPAPGAAAFGGLRLEPGAGGFGVIRVKRIVSIFGKAFVDGFSAPPRPGVDLLVLSRGWPGRRRVAPLRQTDSGHKCSCRRHLFFFFLLFFFASFSFSHRCCFCFLPSTTAPSHSPTATTAAEVLLNSPNYPAIISSATARILPSPPSDADSSSRPGGRRESCHRRPNPFRARRAGRRPPLGPRGAVPGPADPAPDGRTPLPGSPAAAAAKLAWGACGSSSESRGPDSRCGDSAQWWRRWSG